LLGLLILVGISAISCAAILIRLAEAPPFAIAAYRVTIAALLIVPYFALQRRRVPQPWPRGILIRTFPAGLFLALHFAFWIYSLTKTSVASSVILVSTTPIFVALFSVTVLRERLRGRLWLGMLCAMAGSVIIAGVDFSFSRTSLWGDVLALLGAIMASGYFLTGRAVRRSLDLARYSVVAYGGAAVLLLIVCAVSGTSLCGFPPETYLILLLLGVGPQLIGHTTFNWALKFLSPTLVALLVLGEPIGATLLAYFFLGEAVTPAKLTGLIVVGLGIAVASFPAPPRSSLFRSSTSPEEPGVKVDMLRENQYFPPES
jgi:drug/metabolite transporter (DMT)-like permease